MTRGEFLDLVGAEGISSQAYALGGPSGECHVLERAGAPWHVFYAERGVRTGIRRFVFESAALDDLLERLRGDPSTWA